MMLPLDQAGARHSQSPIVANGGAVIEPTYSLSSMHVGQYRSLSRIRTFAGQDDRENSQRLAQKRRAAVKAALSGSFAVRLADSFNLR
jgi:hypothetical protein